MGVGGGMFGGGIARTGAAEAAICIPRSKREAVRERDDKRGTRAPESCGSAKRLRRSRWECGPRMLGAREAIRPEAGCGWAPHESGRPCSARKEAVRERVFPFLTNRGTLMRNTKPFGSRPGEEGTRTRTGRTDTGRTAVGRAGSFNPEEPRSSRFRPTVLNGVYFIL